MDYYDVKVFSLHTEEAEVSQRNCIFHYVNIELLIFLWKGTRNTFFHIHSILSQFHTNRVGSCSRIASSENNHSLILILKLYFGLVLVYSISFFKRICNNNTNKRKFYVQCFTLTMSQKVLVLYIQSKGSVLFQIFLIFKFYICIGYKENICSYQNHCKK